MEIFKEIHFDFIGLKHLTALKISEMAGTDLPLLKVFPTAGKVVRSAGLLRDIAQAFVPTGKKKKKKRKTPRRQTPKKRWKTRGKTLGHEHSA